MREQLQREVRLTNERNASATERELLQDPKERDENELREDRHVEGISEDSTTANEGNRQYEVSFHVPRNDLLDHSTSSFVVSSIVYVSELCERIDGSAWSEAKAR